MRIVKYLSVAALATGLTLSSQVAHADPGEFSGSFPTQEQCVTAGDQGVSDRSWSSYRCINFEGVWDLYTR